MNADLTSRSQPAASDFDRLRDFIRTEIELRDKHGSEPAKPSKYWLDYNKYSTYVRELPDHLLRDIRLHTWHLTGETYASHFSMRDDHKESFVKTYKNLSKRLDGLQPQEPPNGIGFDCEYGRLNGSILRYMLVLGDLHERGLLQRTGHIRLLEIGGGYGGLALMTTQFNPQVSYVICDLEETLFYQAAFLFQHLGAGRVTLVDDKSANQTMDKPGQVYLVPQWRAESALRPQFDIAVNQQSMQEMSAPQVDRYRDILGSTTKYFYSCNKKRHGSTVIREKALVGDLYDRLASRFKIIWDSTNDLSLAARLAIRNKQLRKAMVAVAGSGFLPEGEALLRRFVYQCSSKSGALAS